MTRFDPRDLVFSPDMEDLVTRVFEWLVEHPGADMAGLGAVFGDQVMPLGYILAVSVLEVRQRVLIEERDGACNLYWPVGV